MSSRFAFVLSLALCVSSVAATARADTFLKLDAIPGSSLDGRNKDELVIDSFSFGVSATASMTATGAGVGKPQYDELTFTHAVDRASAALMATISLGRVIKTAVLTVRRSGPSGQTDGYLKISLGNVVVTKVAISGSGNDPVREEITVRFTRISFDHLTQQPDGKMLSSGRPFAFDAASLKEIPAF